MTKNEQKKAELHAKEWWHESIRDDAAGRNTRRAARARLRRASTVIEVIQEPVAHRLIRKLAKWQWDHAAMLVGILAYVENDDSIPVANAIGQGRSDSSQSPKMSEARFRRLLQSEPYELLDPMRRLVRLADGKINVLDLSFSVFHWNDLTRKQWIYYYYGVSEPSSQAVEKEPSS